MAERMLRVLQANGSVRALVVHGHDGLDELTTTTTSTVHELADGEVRTYVVDPAELGIARSTLDDLRGGDAAVNAAFARRVLDGSGEPIATSSCSTPRPASSPPDLASDLPDGLERASASIDDGSASAALQRLVAESQAAAAAV